MGMALTVPQYTRGGSLRTNVAASRMRMRIRLSPIALALALALAARGLAAQRPSPSTKQHDVSVAVGRDRIDVRFPAIALANTGCPYPRPLADGTTERWYEWQAVADFPDRTSSNNHFMTVALVFALHDGTPLTAARLDSAISATRVTVEEARGEPALTTRQWPVARAWARRESGRVRLHVEGADAVRAYLGAGSDSVSVLWCQRDEQLSFIKTRLRR